ncbi:MAG: PEP-CTERM sorting domain-containing protein [Candidatus Hydrogenedentes bacterium]|nr:PEP-CTERM sorting domain-containing protein [Candidatus Hydrogenedentota bacterium]
MVRSVILRATLIALATVSASAGITNGGDDSGSGFNGLAANASEPELSDALDATLNGPQSKSEDVTQSAPYIGGDISNAKSLQAFSRGAKHGGWDDWDWWNWDWDWDHDWPGHGTVVPEPATMLLVGAGLGVIGLRRRISKK